MKVSSRKFLFTLQAAMAIGGLVAALGLGACSRSASVTDSLTGPAKAINSPFAKGPVQGGAPPPPPPPPPPAANPCASLVGLGGAVTAVDASIPQFRVNRLRIEVVGDVAAGTINTLGACSAADAPAVSFVSGTATLGGGASGSFTFGPLLFPGAALEPGVVISNDAAGNVLEIIWPALSGGVPGPPILRFQLANPAGAVTGGTESIRMSFTARAPNGSTATFTARADNLVVPVQR